MVKITRIVERTVGLRSGMRNANISFDEMTASALVVVSDVYRNGRPVAGIAFDSIGKYGHGALLKERFIPRLLSADPRLYQANNGTGIDPFAAWAVVMTNEKLGGHGERAGAVGLLDAALWDLQAKLEDKPLWRVLSERFPGASSPAKVTVYASGGHYRTGEGVSAIADELKRYQDQGYHRFKIKAGGLRVRDDRRRVESALSVLGAHGTLAIDFNAMLDESTVSTLSEFSQYGLAWIEEPVAPLDYQLLKTVIDTYPGPISTGENIFSFDDARNLFRYGGLRPAKDLVNIDISLSYGLVEYLRILELMQAQGWQRSSCVPHAGHLFALQVAAGLGLGGHETAPGDPVFGQLPRDFRLEDGCILLSDMPGVGLERHEVLSPLFFEMMNQP